MAHFIEDMVAENARLKAQAEADVQDRQIERQRRRDVAEANRAAYDEAQSERNRLRHGGGAFSMRPTPDGGALYSESVFGGPGEPTMRAQWADFGLQSRVGSEFADLAQRSATAQRHNSQLATDTMSAALRAAMSNGGRVPKNLMGALSRNLGMDGKTQAAFSAGLLGNGNFDIDVVSRGADGSMQKSTISLDPMQQLNLVNSTPGVWGDAGLAVTKALRNRVRNTHGESEVPGLDVYQNNLKAYKTQKERADTIKMMTGLYQAVYKDLSKGGKQPVTTDVIRARMASDLLKDKNIGPQITSVPDLNEDGTQKMVEDENGNTVPAMRQADPNNPNDVERVRQNIKMRLDLVPEIAPRQDAQGNGETDKRLAFLKYIYDRENPQTPPDVLAFQQRQRERQMQQVEAAQARADITQRPQQLINYFKDGKWYSGNGYIRDGKVYDGQGYEIEGATPAEMVRGEGGRLVQDGRGGFAVRALPSARELVGGGAGGGSAAQGAQGEGGVNWTPGHDLRNDGKTLKGTGWLGVLRLPNGGVASEYTIGVNIDGKEIDIPTLVPTLTKEEQDLMVNDVIPNHKDVPDSIVKKAVDFAKMRLANGRSVFANDGTPQGGQPQPAAAQAQGGAQGDAAQGAEATAAQQSAHKMPPPDRETALAIKAARKNSGRPQQPESQPSQPTSQESAKAKDDLAGNEDVLVKQEADRLRAFKKAGGTYEQDEDGRETVTIGDWEYLSSEDKTKIPRTFDHLDDNVMKYQEKATERKQQFATERAAKEKELKRRAQELFPYSMHRRELFVSSSLKEWEDNWNKSTSEKLSETLGRARPGL